MSNLYVYLIRSRNKDNKDIEGFKERSKTILEYEENEDRVFKEFKDFAAKGLPGEKTRLYKSVNSRNADKIREQLIIDLVKDHNNWALTNMNRLLASIAQQTENRDESKWLFDFDCDDELQMNLFVKDIKDMTKVYWDDENTELAMDSVDVEVHKTPNGYAIIVNHGFDTRELIEKWKDYDITLKRDDLLFLDIIQK